MPRIVSHCLAIALLSVTIWLAGTAWAADPVAGQAVFKSQCTTCHSPAAGKNLIGPSLFGVVGRKTGSIQGYKYSVGNQNANLTWDDATLDKYLEVAEDHRARDHDDVCRRQGCYEACRPDRVS